MIIENMRLFQFCELWANWHIVEEKIIDWFIMLNMIYLQAKSSCVDVPIDVPAAPVGCSDNQDKKDYADEACGVLKSPVFQACHTEVDYTVSYLNCK